MEEEKKLLNDLEFRLNKITFEKDDKKNEIIEENWDLLSELKTKLDSIFNSYLIQEYNNKEQNKESKKLNHIITILLDNSNILKKNEKVNELIYLIISTLEYYENRFIFRLRHSKNIEVIYETIDYQIERDQYIKSLLNKSDNQEIEKYFKDYINDMFEITAFENILNIIEKNERMITRNVLYRITKKIELTNYINMTISEEKSKVNDKKKSILKKYIETIIQLKATIYPELLDNDIIVKKYICGEIKDKEISILIANSIPINVFEYVLYENQTFINKKNIENSNNTEIFRANELLKKAGIEINFENRINNTDNDINYLVSCNDLKNQYDKVNIFFMYSEKEKLYKALIDYKNGKVKINNIQRKTYLDIYIIINMMTNQMKSKINNKLIEFLGKNKLNKKKCDINPNLKLEKQKIVSSETIALLAIIYRDNICSIEERKELIRREKLEILNKELEENKERYNKIYDLLVSLKKKNQT